MWWRVCVIRLDKKCVRLVLLLLHATSLDNRNQQGLAGQYVYSGRVQLCSSLKYAPVKWPSFYITGFLSLARVNTHYPM